MLGRLHEHVHIFIHNHATLRWTGTHVGACSYHLLRAQAHLHTETHQRRKTSKNEEGAEGVLGGGVCMWMKVAVSVMYWRCDIWWFAEIICPSNQVKGHWWSKRSWGKGCVWVRLRVTQNEMFLVVSSGGDGAYSTCSCVRVTCVAACAGHLCLWWQV